MLRKEQIEYVLHHAEDPVEWVFELGRGLEKRIDELVKFGTKVTVFQEQWHPATELPPVDEEKGYSDEVIVIYEEELPSVAGGTFLAERVGYGHIVNPKIAKSYNGWNFPNVKWWCYPPRKEE